MTDTLVYEKKNSLIRLAMLNEGILEEVEYVDEAKASEGSIYLGKITHKLELAHEKTGFFVDIKDGKDAVEITSGTVSGKTGYHFDFGDHREFISLLDQRKAFARILELLDAGKDVKFINFTLGSLYREIQACQQNVIEEATKLLNKLTD